MFRDYALRAHGFEGDIEHDAQTLDDNSRDASIFKVTPQVVVHPKHVHDVQALVRYVAHEREGGDDSISLTARAAGTDMSGGPLSDSIVVSMTRYFDKIHAIDVYPKPKSTRVDSGQIQVDIAGTVTVEPGVYYRFLELALKEKNLEYPSYPASKDLCTIGGIVANNSAGEKTLSFGQTLDYVEEIHMVCADGIERVFRPTSREAWERKMELGTLEGQIYSRLDHILTSNKELLKSAAPHVRKNSAGYYVWRIENTTTDDKKLDITKVITGSQGTLGIITKVKLRLVTPKPHSQMVVTFLNTLADVPELVNLTLKHNPETLESYDDHTFKIAMKFLPSIMKRMLRGGDFFTFMMLGLRFIPEVWMALTGGIPKLVALAEFTGIDEHEVNTRAAKAEFDLRAKGFNARRITNKNEALKYWTFRRESFNLLRSKVKGMRTACFVDDVVIAPEHLPVFLPKMYEIMDKYKMLYTIAGHIGNGNFHVIPLVDPSTPNLKEDIQKCMQEVFALVFSLNGSMAGEHNDGLIRTHLLGDMYGKDMPKIFEQVKDAFDPHHLFNPRKKAYADKIWAWAHVDFPGKK
jgi:FAD/FMN-containing dehydrogenase